MESTWLPTAYGGGVLHLFSCALILPKQSMQRVSSVTDSAGVNSTIEKDFPEPQRY